MATTAEIREQLTGPGGPFEVVTETVNGVEMKVYKSSMGSLREVAQAAHLRGNDPDQPFLVYGDLRRVHRSALIACVYRAAEWRHKQVELAAHELLQELDRTAGIE